MGPSASLSDKKHVLCQEGCLLSVFFSVLVNTFQRMAPVSEKCHWLSRWQDRDGRRQEQLRRKY